MNEIDYIEDRQRNVIKLFHERGELSFNSLIEITGWEEYVLAKILKLLLSKDVIEEYFDERPDWDALLPPYAKMEQIKVEVLDIVDEHFEKIER